MKVLVFLCFLLSLVALSEGLFGRRSLAGNTRSRFAALLKRRPFGSRIRLTDSIFSRFSARKKTPICHFDKNGVPQYSWPTKDKLCFDESYAYPEDRVFDALAADQDAMDYMILVQKAYVNELANRTGRFGEVRYKDLCSEEGPLLERIWWTNTMNGQREVCYVIMPDDQGIRVPLGGGNCVMDKTVVQHHYCVPDGFVDREIYVFCPGEVKQCRRTRVTVPTGCSCKKYDCLKFKQL